MRPRYDYAVRIEGPTLRQVHHAVRRMWEVVSWANFKRRFRLATPVATCCEDAGHQVAAFLIRDNIRQQDYIARYGGEEFVLVLAYPDMHDALACVERIRTLISEASFPGLPGDYPVTVSMGLTRYQPEETIDSLLIRADDALYRAKRSGKNATACEPSSLLQPAA
ncbi:MAG TPA: diguanylate cyclase, partial [Deltaproteobacteria bacterium]|nr:diguanylate cyclase [Deltaproteobacteria bacterium]